MTSDRVLVSVFSRPLSLSPSLPPHRWDELSHQLWLPPARDGPGSSGSLSSRPVSRPSKAGRPTPGRRRPLQAGSSSESEALYFFFFSSPGSLAVCGAERCNGDEDVTMSSKVQQKRTLKKISLSCASVFVFINSATKALRILIVSQKVGSLSEIKRSLATN